MPALAEKNYEQEAVPVSSSEEQSINPGESQANLCSEVELLTKLDILVIHGNITGWGGGGDGAFVYF